VRRKTPVRDLVFDPKHYKPRKLTKANVLKGDELWWAFCNNMPDKMLRQLDSLQAKELATIRGEVLAVITGDDVFSAVPAEQAEWVRNWVESVAPGILKRALWTSSRRIKYL
jgi:hypothetical protein